MKRRKITLCFLLLSLSVILMGCGGEGAEAQQLFSGAGTTYNVSFLSFPELWYNFCIMAKPWDAILIIGSMLIGIILCDVFKKNREIHAWAFSVLVFKMPLFIYVVIRVYSSLYGAFNLDEIGTAYGVSSIMQLELWYYNVGIIAKRWAPVVIVGSLIIGMIIYDVCKKMAEIRKWALSVLIGTIPPITFVATYVYTGLYGVFNI